MGRRSRKNRKRRKRRKERRERERKAQRERVTITFGEATATTCPLCRELVSSGSELERAICGGCEVAYHRECVLELGGCATLGCERRGQVPSEPPSSDPSWDRYRERVAAERASEDLGESEEGSPRSARARAYAVGAGRLGALGGGVLGFLGGGLASVSSGFDLAAAFAVAVAGLFAGAAYLGAAGGLVGYLGIKEEPVPYHELLLLLFGFGAFSLGGVLGEALGSGLVGALLGLPIGVAISLHFFGFRGRSRARVP